MPSSSPTVSRSNARQRPTHCSTSVQTRRYRSCSITADAGVVLVTAGDPARRTGGNLYNQRMVAALRRAGHRVTKRIVRRPADLFALRHDPPAVALLDTIAAPFVAKHIPALRHSGTFVVTLAHMELGAARLGRGSDLVIAVSDTLKRTLVRAGVDRRRIVVVRPGRDGALAGRSHGPALPEPSRRRHPSAGRMRALCVANWAVGKGIHTLIAAAAHVPEITLELVGDAPDAAYARRIRSSAARVSPADRIRIYGSLDRDRLARRYAEAAIFVLPSVREGFGTVYAEALAYGRPVIACDLPITREVVGSAGILVPRRRVRPLAKAMRHLATDQRLRARLVRHALERARSLPRWSESEARLVRVIGDVLRRGSSRPDVRRTRGKP